MILSTPELIAVLDDELKETLTVYLSKGIFYSPAKAMVSTIRK